MRIIKGMCKIYLPKVVYVTLFSVVLVEYWKWFIVPVFMLPLLPFKTAVAIILLSKMSADRFLGTAAQKKIMDTIMMGITIDDLEKLKTENTRNALFQTECYVVWFGGFFVLGWILHKI